MKKVTLKQIAAEAGVSITAASMYLNGKAKRYNLADATCERIEAVVRKHNFTPNFHARAIAKGKTFLAGVILSQELEGSFWLNILSGLEEFLSTRQYHMLLSVTHGDKKREHDAIEFMRRKGVDGIIINPVSRENLTGAGIPLITLNRPIPGIPGVWNDNYAGGKLAVNHLLSKGHRKIAFLGTPGHRRAQAYAERMSEIGEQPAFFDSVDDFLPHRRNFSAVFCFSDYLLLELYEAVRASGIRVPEELSLIGYDNMPFIRLLSPRPASVSQVKNELGKAAGELLLRLIDDPETEEREISFIPELIPGESVRRLSLE